MGRRWAFAAAMASALAWTTAARATDLPRVPLDGLTGALGGTLPHRSDFFLDVIAPAEFDRATVTYWESNGSTCAKLEEVGNDRKQTAFGVAAAPAQDGHRTIPVRIATLEYSTGYCFSVNLRRTWTSADTAKAKEVLVRLLADTPNFETSSVLEARLASSIGTIANLTFPASPGQTVGARIAKQVFDDVWVPARQACMSVGEDAGIAQQRAVKLRTLLSTIEKPAAAVTAMISALYSAHWPRPGKLDASGAAELAAVRTAIQASRVEVCAGLTGDPKPRLCDPNAAIDQAVAGLDAAADAYVDCAKYDHDGLAAAIDRVMASIPELETAATTSGRSVATATPGFTERAPFYISGELGGVVPIFPGSGADFALFAGISFTFLPVDKDVPLRGFAFGKRFSLNAGFTLTNIADPAGSARGVLDGKGVLLGAGFRITDYVRIGAGAMLIRQRDADQGESVRVTPYVSASVDVDVVGTIRGMFAKATP